MNKLYPNAVARRVWQITPQLLNSWGVKGLILDIDNTLTTHNNPIPEPQVAQWLEDNRRAGIRMIVLSNNHPERVRPFAQALGLEFIADGAKPLKKGYQRCSQALGLPCEQLCMVGDQIFTDVLGGRRAGCRAVLVQPIQPEKMLFFRLKRALEALPCAAVHKRRHSRFYIWGRTNDDRKVWTGRQLGQLSGDGLPKDRAGAGIYPPDGSGRL